MMIRPTLLRLFAWLPRSARKILTMDRAEIPQERRKPGRCSPRRSSSYRRGRLAVLHTHQREPGPGRYAANLGTYT